jgi:hypothetical protein
MKLTDTGFVFADPWRGTPVMCGKRYKILNAYIEGHRSVSFVYGSCQRDGTEKFWVLTFRDSIHEKKLTQEFLSISEGEKKARVARLFGK